MENIGSTGLGSPSADASLFPSTGGRTLGTTQRRTGSSDARGARLEALEKRSKPELDSEAGDEV